MDKACTEGGALAESVVFLKYFSDLPDPRQRGKVMYRLDEILLLAVLAGAETIVDIARFGEKKRELLRRFRPFGDGTPPQASHPCFAGRVRSLLRPLTTTSATSWRRSMPKPSSAVLSPGSAR